MNPPGAGPAGLHQELAQLADTLGAYGYVSSRSLATSLHLATRLGKPLLLEGEAGVGKTALATALARSTQRELIRLQCYEGLDAQHALYDWDYRRQLLALQREALRDRSAPDTDSVTELYAEPFLLRRPLLDAIARDTPVVLLIDEVDRADEAFEALLLEVLSDFQVSIPELGTFKARTAPYVLLTSNGVRDLSDALRRRCLYHYIEYPDPVRECQIVRAHLPQIDQQLLTQVVALIQQLRQQALRKTPGVTETLDWATALMRLGARDLGSLSDTLETTLGCVLKTREDLQWLAGQPGILAGWLAGDSDAPPLSSD